MRPGLVGIALLCVVLPCAAAEKEFDVSFSARAYFESAYLSSGGGLTYTEPVAEQYAVLTAHLRDYGRVWIDAWICSALNDQADHIHRRYGYICEDTPILGLGVGCRF